MRAGRVGAERSCMYSCMYFFAHVVGARIAGVVCACVCAGMRPEAARWAPTRPRAAEQAAARRDLMRMHIKHIILIFSS